MSPRACTRLQVIKQRDATLVLIGNVVHDSVPISDDEVRACSHTYTHVCVCFSPAAIVSQV